jgi:hypothetical protein
MGALFVLAYGAWFASIRETAADLAGQTADVRSHVYAPAPVSSVYLRAQSTSFQPATDTMDDGHDRIYKCIDKSGATTFQQLPCGAGSKTDRVIPYVPRPEPVRAQSFSSLPAVAQAPQYAAPAASNFVSSNTECKAAEIWADDRRRQLGTHATFEDLRILQDYVYEHCK